MYKLFIGSNTFNARQVGCINDYNTEIFRGQSVLGGTQIGKIDLNTVYRWDGRRAERIGRFGMGNVYRLTDGREILAGTYDNGHAYKGTGWNKREIGRYEGGAAGAAALLLLFDGEI